VGTPAVLRPLSVGEKLDVAIKIYLKHAWTMFKIVALVVVPVQFLSAFVTTSVAPDVVANGSNQVVTATDRADLNAFLVAAGIVGLLSLIVTLVATAACFKAVSDAYLGQSPTVGTSLRFALKKLRSLTWLALISALLLVLALIALVIPGIWLWIAWSVSTPALLFEGFKGTKALRRSFRLIKGYWWPTFGAILLSLILAGVVSGLIRALFSTLVFTDARDSFFLRSMLGAISGSISGVLTTPFQAALVTIIFFDAKVRKEGFDLQLLAQGMGSDASLGAAPDFFPPPPPPAPSETPPYWPPPPGWQPSQPSSPNPELGAGPSAGPPPPE
jgi:hypothetical protein